MVCLKPFSPLSHHYMHLQKVSLSSCLAGPLAWLLYHLEDEFLMNTFQGHPAMLVALLCSPSSRAGQVPHEDQGLGR